MALALRPINIQVCKQVVSLVVPLLSQCTHARKNEGGVALISAGFLILAEYLTIHIVQFPNGVLNCPHTHSCLEIVDGLIHLGLIVGDNSNGVNGSEDAEVPL